MTHYLDRRLPAIVFHFAFCILGFAFCLVSLPGCGDSSRRVVVYCAHDQEFAEDILQEFQKRTGLEVKTRYDTEANKAVGLYEDLIREAVRPRCDVHWNNEILATIRLQEKGVYQPYASPAAAPFPARYKAADNTWTAFAARARVILINTDKVKPADYPKSLKDLLDPAWKGKVVMAKPQFGTTATHAACLFQVWGETEATEFFKKLKANDVRIVPGNKHVAQEVSAGKNAAIGLTDTDDAMGEIEAGNKVAMLFLEKETLFIPNTAAIVKGCPNPEGARKLVEFLLSPEIETRLAEAKSRQVPLNPQVKADLPTAMQPALKVAPMEVDFALAARNWERYQDILVKTLNLPR
jgi:iron(III) transport system substrate-binding protein